MNLGYRPRNHWIILEHVMQAVELTTHIDEKGTVHLPADYQSAFGRQVCLIVLLEETEHPAAPTNSVGAVFVDALKDSPNFNEDPVAIQRQMRDEWR